ncbi:MAG: CCA tRNA nucleotidyltransferase [Phreatobacter sp.]|uniref:CCA tRNA nucleotidyltransferase n=1 Tax=Phreatobacter sp. TaxID=1966341 RepID=UPI00273243E7|nr:CCA tRNA nucleotidyltransferase [Phreatobacter sp.]MDP2802419.1 CCA tRNA nucleotidyltransferase [Phreatobacter sp.]
MSTLPPPPGWLAAGDVPRLIRAIGVEGDAVRVVGGAVRNWLIGLPPGDIDLATTAEPGAVSARAVGAGFKVVPTGIAHGTVTVVVDGTGYEVTTLRQDIATDGRRAIVRFGRDWEADAARRDFTINAMSLSADGDLFDYFGGRSDLAGGKVRFIGDALQRVREDRLRILRLFRFHATYARGEVDRAALSACIAEREGLADLSRERLRAEIMKLVVAPRAGATLQAMADCGLLGQVLGGVPLAAGVDRLATVEAELSIDADPVQRLASLAVLIREDALRLRERLALSNAEFRRLDGIGHGWRRDPATGLTAAKELLYAVGPRGFRDRVLIGFARSAADPADPAWRDLLSLPERWTAPHFPVSGEELQRRGLAAGPDLGTVLSAIRTRWMAADFPVAKDQVGALVEEALAECGHLGAGSRRGHESEC